MTVPVLSWGGWADNYMNTVAHLVENVPAPVQGIVGPWVHQYPHTAVPGPAIGFLQVALRWWDRWLKGIENGAEYDPAYRAYMIHSEAPDACGQASGGALAGRDAPGQARGCRGRCWRWGLAGEAARPPQPRHWRHIGRQGLGRSLRFTVNTPQHLGMHTGEFFPMGLNAEMPGDQASDDAMSVCFDGAVLAEPLDLAGRCAAVA